MPLMINQRYRSGISKNEQKLLDLPAKSCADYFQVRELCRLKAEVWISCAHKVLQGTSCDQCTQWLKCGCTVLAESWGSEWQWGYQGASTLHVRCWVGWGTVTALGSRGSSFPKKDCHDYSIPFKMFLDLRDRIRLVPPRSGQRN